MLLPPNDFALANDQGAEGEVLNTADASGLNPGSVMRSLMPGGIATLRQGDHEFVLYALNFIGAPEDLANTYPCGG